MPGSRPSTPAPTLLVRLPYGKDLPQLLAYGLVPNVFALVEAGYAVVYQDCRGTLQVRRGVRADAERARRRRRHRGLAARASRGATATSAATARPTWASCSGRACRRARR